MNAQERFDTWMFIQLRLILKSLYSYNKNFTILVFNWQFSNEKL